MDTAPKCTILNISHNLWRRKQILWLMKHWWRNEQKGNRKHPICHSDKLIAYVAANAQRWKRSNKKCAPQTPTRKKNSSIFNAHSLEKHIAGAQGNHLNHRSIESFMAIPKCLCCSSLRLIVEPLRFDSHFWLIRCAHSQCHLIWAKWKLNHFTQLCKWIGGKWGTN